MRDEMGNEKADTDPRKQFDREYVIGIVAENYAFRGERAALELSLLKRQSLEDYRESVKIGKALMEEDRKAMERIQEFMRKSKDEGIEMTIGLNSPILEEQKIIAHILKA